MSPAMREACELIAKAVPTGTAYGVACNEMVHCKSNRKLDPEVRNIESLALIADAADPKGTVEVRVEGPPLRAAERAIRLWKEKHELDVIA